jgi:polyhydroxyalkanoate synthase
MSVIETVRGPVDAGSMGQVLMHEHLFLLGTEFRQNYPDYPDPWDEDMGEKVGAVIYGGQETVNVDNVLERLIDTGGGSLRAGLANLVHDLRSPAKLPASVDKSAFTLGKDLASTPGKVVRRSRLYELIEYQPVTQSVDVVPVVMIPSPVNKYYLLDLEPGGSVIRAELERGRRVFVASWVNPDESHADQGFDAYVAGIVEVLETTAEIAGTEAAHLLGLCGGGQLVQLAAAYLAAIGRQHELATLTIGIAVADYERGPATMAFLDRRTAGKAIERATARGYFDAFESARAFAVIRPDEGIWANVVNNYLLGQKPPAMGLLYWAADNTNMTTGFGRDTIETALDNSLIKPGGVSILGVPIDTRQITVDTYVLGGSTDQRAADPDRWLAGMNKLQRRLEDHG